MVNRGDVGAKFLNFPKMLDMDIVHFQYKFVAISEQGSRFHLRTDFSPSLFHFLSDVFGKETKERSIVSLLDRSTLFMQQFWVAPNVCPTSYLCIVPQPTGPIVLWAPKCPRCFYPLPH